MPWSPWITPAPEPINAIYVRGIMSETYGSGPQGSMVDAVTAWRAAAAARDAATSDGLLLFNESFDESAETFEFGSEIVGEPGMFSAGGYLSQRDWWVSTTKRFESIGGLGNLRNWFPDEMNDLVYGVDYGPRPDRDEMEDDDAYVEFEPGFDSTRVGWQGVAQLDWNGSSTSGADTDPEVSAELRLEAEWTPPDLPIPMPGAAGELWWSDSGAPVLGGYTGDDASGPGTPIDFGDALPDADEFAVVLATFPSSGDIELLEGDWLYQYRVKASVQVDALIQYPRFRYWIPGILPLRQYPRNDGLRGGAPNARATSRQATTARRTYL